MARIWLPQLLAVTAFVLLSQPFASAAVITLSSVRSITGFDHATIDYSTGKVYERVGNNAYYNEVAVRTFNSISDFESNNVASNFSLQSSGPAGAYIAALNGSLFGRTPFADTETIKWNATTGQLQQTSASYIGMGGINGTHTFDWGGFSGANLFQDNTGMYVLGKSSSGSTWQVAKIDSNLNVLETKTFAQTQAGNYGYAALINGTFFLGNTYNSGQIDAAFNFASGTTSSVSFLLGGLPGYTYLHSTMYDAATDALYIASFGTGYFKVENASVQFGVPLVSDVPEPASMATWCLVAVGLTCVKRKRRQTELTDC